MAMRTTKCTVVEIPASSQGGPDDAPPRDLLPWADPYIALLLSKHRLQAALEDSISFVEREAVGRPLSARRRPFEPAGACVEPCFPKFDLDDPLCE